MKVGETITVVAVVSVTYRDVTTAVLNDILFAGML
jgi:hypothetical protein